MGKANITIKIDPDLKKQAEELFTDLGLDLSTAINLFLHQAIRLEKIPFKIAVNRPEK